MKIITLIFLISITLLIGCGDNKTDTRNEKKPVDSELIREEGTDVAALDVNKDGALYQCPMDFQVISDKMESCPVCKMDLEEVSISDAVKNLENHYK